MNSEENKNKAPWGLWLCVGVLLVGAAYEFMVVLTPNIKALLS